jgi:hypothetical protein
VPKLHIHLFISPNFHYNPALFPRLGAFWLGLERTVQEQQFDLPYPALGVINN